MTDDDKHALPGVLIAAIAVILALWGLFALGGCASVAPDPKAREREVNAILERYSERGEAVDVSRLTPEEREILAR